MKQSAIIKLCIDNQVRSRRPHHLVIKFSLRYTSFTFLEPRDLGLLGDCVFVFRTYARPSNPEENVGLEIAFLCFLIFGDNFF